MRPLELILDREKRGFLEHRGVVTGELRFEFDQLLSQFLLLPFNRKSFSNQGFLEVEVSVLTLFIDYTHTLLFVDSCAFSDSWRGYG